MVTLRAAPPNDATEVQSEEARELPIDLLDFSPEQWAWLVSESKRFEDGYVPTRSLIPGL